MKLLYSTTSPYARKVLVAAYETGLAGEIETVTRVTNVLDPPAALQQQNPLAKVPVLLMDDGTALFDSPVICEYLDSLSRGARLIPKEGPARWRVLTGQALADGLMDAGLLVRMEDTLRPEAIRFEAWRKGQMAKIWGALERMDATVGELDGVDLRAISYGCALGYLGLRFSELGWQARYPALGEWFSRFAERPSMLATAP